MKKLFSILLASVFIFSISCKNVKITGSSAGLNQLTKKEKEDQTCPGDKYENETKPTRAEIYQKWSLFLASKTPAELARWNQSDREQAHKDAAEYCGVDVVYFKETVFGSKSA